MTWQMVVSSALDVATLMVFVPATAAIWVLHSGSPQRWRLTAAGVFIVLVSAVAIALRTARGVPLPVWFLLPYLLMVLAMVYVIFTNVLVLQRNREKLIELRRHQ